jgi:hypothetical protein
MERMKTEELEPLSKFVGRWSTEGIIPATGMTPEVRICGTDTYDWLPGGFFLVHKVDVFVGSDKNETLEIIGFDKKIGAYTMQYYDNKGHSGFMTATCIDGVWTFTGETLRFNGGFKKDDKEFSGVWEQSTDGNTWFHFMDIKLTKDD